MKTSPIIITTQLKVFLANDYVPGIMSRRASVFARNNPGKRRVRFPDEVIFEHEVKEQDGHAVINMLRRASIDIDINRINSAGKNLKRLLKPRV